MSHFSERGLTLWASLVISGWSTVCRNHLAAPLFLAMTRFPYPGHLSVYHLAEPSSSPAFIHHQVVFCPTKRCFR